MKVILVLLIAVILVLGALMGSFLFGNIVSGIGIGIALGAGVAGVLVAYSQEVD